MQAEGAGNAAGANLIWELALSLKLALNIDVPS